MAARLPRALLAVCAVCACARPGAQISREAAALQLDRADRAISLLRSELTTRLSQEIAENGPVGAIGACGDEAARLSSQIGRAERVELGRTSFRLRNARNAPRPWAAAWVDGSAGRKAVEVERATFELGDRIGVLEPIPVGAMCLTCHGPERSLDPEVAAQLHARYPQDQALGFAAGDLRGFFWAEVSTAAR